MPVTVIPFQMPQPMDIPAHVVEMLGEMAPDEAVKRGMELLTGIEAAETIVYERVTEEGTLELGSVASTSGEALALEDGMGREAFYGKPLQSAGASLAGTAFARALGEIARGLPAPG